MITIFLCCSIKNTGYYMKQCLKNEEVYFTLKLKYRNSIENHTDCSAAAPWPSQWLITGRLQCTEWVPELLNFDPITPPPPLFFIWPDFIWLEYIFSAKRLCKCFIPTELHFTALLSKNTLLRLEHQTWHQDLCIVQSPF